MALHVHQPRPQHRARGVRRHRGAVRRPEGRGDGAAPAFSHAPRHPYFHLLATSVPELRPGWLDEVGAGAPRGAAAGSGARPIAPGCAASWTAARCASQASATRRRRRGASSKRGVEVFCHRSAEELLALQQVRRAAARKSRPDHKDTLHARRTRSLLSLRPVRARSGGRRRVAQRPSLPDRLPFAGAVLRAPRQRVDVRRRDLEGRAESGATMVQALFPNTYIDANRHELDIDRRPDRRRVAGAAGVRLARAGLGLLKTVSRYGEPLQERKLTVAEVQHRLDRYYRPYHRELASIMDRMLTAQGFYYNLSCHCMSAVGRADARGRRQGADGFLPGQPARRLEHGRLHRVRRRSRSARRASRARSTRRIPAAS